MKNSFFINGNQLDEWIKAAENIRESFGPQKALGYLIGEKFYNTIRSIHSSRRIIKSIEEQRKKANGHVLSEEEHELMVSKGAIEHSLETEIEDAFIYGEMVKYLMGE